MDVLVAWWWWYGVGSGGGGGCGGGGGGSGGGGVVFSPIVTKPQQSRSRVGICRPSWGVLLVFAAAVRLPRDGTDPERTPAEVADPERTPTEGHEKYQVP